MDVELKTATRDLVKRFVSELEKVFVLSEEHATAKGMFPRLQEMNENGRCWACKAPADGHFYEECVARMYGRIDHLYRKKAEGAV